MRVTKPAAFLIVVSLATAPVPAHADCYSAINQADCYRTQLDQVRRAQQQIEDAARDRRFYESFPPGPDDSFSNYLSRTREDAARRQLEDALR